MTIVNRLYGAIIAALLTHGPGPLAAAGLSLEMGLPFGNEAVLQQQVMTQMLKPAVEDKGARIQWLSIQGKDQVWHWADGAFDGNDLIVSSEKVNEPIAVRYAYAANPAGSNLYNRAGLPAATFTTTDYESQDDGHHDR